MRRSKQDGKNNTTFICISHNNIDGKQNSNPGDLGDYICQGTHRETLSRRATGWMAAIPVGAARFLGAKRGGHSAALMAGRAAPAGSRRATRRWAGV